MSGCQIFCYFQYFFRSSLSDLKFLNLSRYCNNFVNHVNQAFLRVTEFVNVSFYGVGGVLGTSDKYIPGMVNNDLVTDSYSLNTAYINLCL